MDSRLKLTQRVETSQPPPQKSELPAINQKQDPVTDLRLVPFNKIEAKIIVKNQLRLDQQRSQEPATKNLAAQNDYSQYIKKKTTVQLTHKKSSEYDSLLDNQSVNYKGSIKKQQTFKSVATEEPDSAQLNHLDSFSQQLLKKRTNISFRKISAHIITEQQDEQEQTPHTQQ